MSLRRSSHKPADDSPRKPQITTNPESGKVRIAIYNEAFNSPHVILLTAAEAGDFLGSLRKVVIAVEELQRGRA
jgi:hypothetical protein